MNFYVFYRIKDGRGFTLDIPELYGFTDKKSIRDEFMKQRDMNIFYLMKRSVSDELLKDFTERYKHRELSYQKMYTRNPYNPMAKTTIDVLTTWAEIDHIMTKADIIINELSKYVDPSIYYLKNEHIKELDILYYLNVCRFTKSKFTSEFFSGFENYSNKKEIIDSNLDYDEFALYMYFVAYTYK